MKKQSQRSSTLVRVSLESSPGTSMLRGRAHTSATNLTLHPSALVKVEAFSELHGTSLSKLINGSLESLPSLDETRDVPNLSPTLERLYGAAAGGEAGIAAYKEFLYNKHTKE